MKSKANKLMKVIAADFPHFPWIVSCGFMGSKINDRWPRGSQIPGPNLHKSKSREKTDISE